MAGKIADYGVCVSVGEKPKYLVVRVGESGWPGKQPVMNDVSRYGSKRPGISTTHFRSLLGFWHATGGCLWGRDSSYHKAALYSKGPTLSGAALLVVRIVPP